LQTYWDRILRQFFGMADLFLRELYTSKKPSFFLVQVTVTFYRVNFSIDSQWH
jgi:hypothetical protein